MGKIEIKLQVVNPLGEPTKSVIQDMDITSIDSRIHERYLLTIGECLYWVNRDGLILERIIPHENTTKIMSNKMSRTGVYKSIDTEREYQEKETKNPENLEMIEDFNMGTAMQALNVLLRQAGDKWYHDCPEDDYQDTMEYLRKIVGVCVKMGEKHGMPNRK